MTKVNTNHKNKRILVGVTGGIAAYKTPDLVRRLIERGADVRVVMTQGAKEFITPLSLQAVSGQPVFEHLLDTDAESGMGHIEIARWAEMIVIAPATANCMAKIVQGKADDLLSTLVLASEAELIIAPAMNQQMWQNPATQSNLELLRQRGVKIIGPGAGDQACGEIGPGRMTEPSEIAQQLLGDGIPQLLQGVNILLTAGPTWEALDPVRGITNHSSGKMGFCLAEAARDFGANVTIISGPVHLETPRQVNRVDVVSARDMLQQVMSNLHGCDIFIGVAAVADYRPENVADQKIKKDKDVDELVINLVKNPDILAEVAMSSNKPFTVGFAAETEDLIANAQKKLRSKKIDMIIANNVAGKDGAFGSDENAVTLIHPEGEIELPRNDKYRLAIEIIQNIWQLKH